jgi:DNA polymerase (family X)
MKREIIDKLKNHLKKYIKNKFEIVGSYIRGEKSPKDIDIVIKIEPKDINKLKTKLKEILDVKYLGKGKKRITMKIKYENHNIKVDIWPGTEKEYLFKKFSYSGSKKYNIISRAQAKRKGYILNDTGLFKNNKRVQVKTERELYKLIGRTYVPYKDRI